MKKVVIDTNICVFAILEKATPNRTEMIQKAKDLLDHLSDKKADIFIPTPVLTELLIPVTAESDRKGLMATVYERFKIAPFDDVAAEIAAGIYIDNKPELKEMYNDFPNDGIKARMKYDIMILAIAISKGVDEFYTEDTGLKKLAIKHNVKVLSCDSIPKPQPDLFG